MRSIGRPVAKLRSSGAAADRERVVFENETSKNSSRQPDENGNRSFVENDENEAISSECVGTSPPVGGAEGNSFVENEEMEAISFEDVGTSPPVGGAVGKEEESTSVSTGTSSFEGEEGEE